LKKIISGLTRHIRNTLLYRQPCNVLRENIVVDDVNAVNHNIVSQYIT